MILTGNSISVEMPTPEYGYSAIVHQPFKLVETSSGWKGWNNEGFLYRSCKIPSFLFSRTELSSLSEFLLDETKGRNTELTLSLGDYETGFFPFGPDLGDKGNFIVRIISRSNSGIQDSPWLYFRSEVEFVLVSAPDYTLPAQVTQGGLQIGTISGLMYPQQGIKPKAVYGLSNVVSNGGAVNGVDLNNNKFTTEFTQNCNQSKAAALVNYLVDAALDDISIVAPANYYAFGVENGSSGTYTAMQIKSDLEIKHLEYDQFEIGLEFFMQAAA